MLKFTYQVTINALPAYDDKRYLETVAGEIEAEDYTQAKEKAQSRVWDRCTQLKHERGMLVGYENVRITLQTETQPADRAVLTPQEYMRCALRTLYPDLTQSERLGLCGLGLPGEIGEVVDYIKKFCYHRNGKPLAKDQIKDELGDVLWYYFILLDALGLTFQEMMRADVPKYERRYAVFSGLNTSGQLEFCGLELASNLGKVVDLLNRFLYYCHESLDVNDLKDRLGDVLWSMLLLLDTLGLTFEEVMMANAMKLEERHPNGFNPHYPSDSHASEGSR